MNQMSPLRIAIVTRAMASLHGPGGLERHVDDLVRHLLASGTAVTLITRPSTRVVDSQQSEILNHQNLTFHPISYRTFPGFGYRGTTILDRNSAYPFFGWRAGRVAARLAQDGQIDLVHGHGASVFGFARTRQLDNCRVPFVLNPHGMEEFGGFGQSRSALKALANRPLQLAVRACAHAADCIIATDKAMVPNVVSNLRTQESRVTVVPNAVDLEICDSHASVELGRQQRTTNGITPSELLILSVGRLDKNKGFDVLARALAQVNQSQSGQTPVSGLEQNWRWVVVGEGPEHRALVKLVNQLGIGGRTVFTGRLSDADVHAWYETASLFIHPTLYEGSSLATLEAMAHRRPVIATMVGGLPDKVEHGVSGWLVEPGSVTALAAAIRDAIGQTERLATMGQAGRSIVERDFSWNTVIKDLLAVYRELLLRAETLGDV